MDRLSVSGPSQTRFPLHGAVAETTVGSPLLNNVLDELDLSAEVIRRRDALNLWFDLRPPPRCRSRSSR